MEINDLTPSAQRMITKHGYEKCQEAFRLNQVEGEGPYMVGCLLGVHINSADAMINAGREIAKRDKQTELLTDGQGNRWYYQELNEAFEAVQDKEDWRNPINAYTPHDKLAVTRYAIIFFTATEPDFIRMTNGWYNVKAAGYRKGPAA